MRKKRIIIGLTGFIASGKGSAADIVKNEFGFAYYSLSDQVRQMAKYYGNQVTREILQSIGDEMRHMLGGDILAKLTAALIWAEAKDHAVIDGIRNPHEVEFLRQNPYFKLIAVVAESKVRFERLLKRGRPSDPKTFEDFIIMDDRDQGMGQNDLGQQVKKCVDMADYVLDGNGLLKDFQKRVRTLVRKI
ncbi:MAG: AAA family ATPase [Candidatus Portnoybacteria bacterium]|nr:AAA family ATPase [Candidatus Portnoybacteria bacterium]